MADSDALQLALATSIREPDELLGYLFSSSTTRRPLPLEKLRVTLSEFSALFGCTARPVRDGGVDATVSKAEFALTRDALSKALKCSIAEREAAAAWNRAQGKAASYVALHMHDSEQALRIALGGLVHADRRRLEELTAALDDPGEVDVMLLGRVIVALSLSVV